VQGTNNDGVWNEKGTYITIIINPPWWRTWWAYGVYALLIISGIWLIVSYRSKYLRRELEQTKKEQQLSEMRQKTAELQKQATELEMQALRAQMNPHFIFNSLNSINRFILQNNKAQFGIPDQIFKAGKDVLQNSQVIDYFGKRTLNHLNYISTQRFGLNSILFAKFQRQKTDIDVLQVPL
jgi:hypothetical protein